MAAGFRSSLRRDGVITGKAQTEQNTLTAALSATLNAESKKWCDRRAMFGPGTNPYWIGAVHESPGYV
jgi:hypothetical protein